MAGFLLSIEAIRRLQLLTDSIFWFLWPLKHSASESSRQGNASPFPPNVLHVMDEETRHRQTQIQAEMVVIWVGSTFFGQRLAQQGPNRCLRSWVPPLSGKEMAPEQESKASAAHPSLVTE